MSYVLLCDKNLPACTSAIIVLTAPLVLNFIYYCGLFSFTGNPRLPFLMPKLTKHQVVQAQSEDSIFLTPRDIVFRSILPAPRHRPLLDLQLCSSVDPVEMARSWSSRTRALSEVHTPCLATTHPTGLQLTTGTAWSPNWGLSWDTAQALAGSAGKAQHGLRKSRWKFSVDFWGDHDFSSPHSPWQSGGVHRRAWRGEKNLLEEGSLEHICWWMASHPMHLDGAKSWTMRSITNIQTSQTWVYRDHSLELKAWEFLKEKVWSGAVHVSQELCKCLCNSQNLMRKLGSWAKHIVKMESRLLHSSVSWKNRMYVNVRKERSLKVHSTSRKLSKEQKTRTCRAGVPQKNLISAPESWPCKQSCRITSIISQTIWMLSPACGSCRQTGSLRHF